MSDKAGIPTAVIVIDTSWIAYDTRGEIVETVETLADGSPDWSYAGGCDHRGGGGAEGFRLLAVALDAAEENARLCGFDVVRLPADWGNG